jgi:hypothetical protein
VPLGAPVQIIDENGEPKTIQKYYSYNAKPDAKKDFFDKGLTVINDVSYSLGDDHSSFLMSFQDMSAKGTIRKIRTIETHSV